MNVLAEFAHHTLPYFYLNSKLRLSYSSGTKTATFSDGVTSFIDGSGNSKITRTDSNGTNDVKINDDMFIPEGWRSTKEIMAYSLNGITKTWTFPSDWNSVSYVDVYNVTVSGPSLLQSNVSISGHTISLTLDDGGSSANGTYPVQYTDNGSNNQRYIVTEISSGVYTLCSVGHSRALDNYGHSNNGDYIQSYDLNSGGCQQWNIKGIDGIYCRIDKAGTTKAIAVNGASTADNAQMVLWDDNGGYNQYWRFVEVN